MKYLNAFEGIKKVYKAEIMSIVAAVLSLVTGVLSAIGTASDNGAVVGVGIVVIIAAILYDCRGDYEYLRRQPRFQG